jgi:hypothetical protein
MFTQSIVKPFFAFSWLSANSPSPFPQAKHIKTDSQSLYLLLHSVLKYYTKT